MREYIEIIRRSKLESIILKFIIILFCLFTVILNSKTYMTIFKTDGVVNSYDGLIQKINKNEKFITLDLTNAKLQKYSMISDDNDKLNIYSVPFDDNDFLVVLKDNTALTNSVTLQILNYDFNMKDIKEKLEYNNIYKFSDKKYFSNVNYLISEKIIKIKFYFTVILLFLMIVFLPVDIYLYINPKKTFKYKKMVK